MKEHEKFLTDHGMRPENIYVSYHYSYALYAWYMIESMRMAEDIEDGLCFDELEAALLVDGLSRAHAAMKHFRSRMQVPFAEFDIAETIMMKGCRLEAGKFKGSEKEAERIAGKWIADYRKRENSLFCFEVGVYISFLLGREVDYWFLAGRRGEGIGVHHGQGSETAGLGIQPEKVSSV